MPPCTASRSPTVASGSPPERSPRRATAVEPSGCRAHPARPGALGGDRPRPRLRPRQPTSPSRVVYDGLVAYHYASADPQVLVPDLAISVPEPTDGGQYLHLQPPARDPVLHRCRGPGLRLRPRCAARALRSSGPARPDFYAGIVGGQACIDDRTTCDLSNGVVADDAAGRVTFHLVAPDPQFLYKLTLLVVPTPPGTPLGPLTSPLPGTGPYRVADFDPGPDPHPRPATPTSTSGLPRPSRPGSSTASPGSRWPTPTRRRTPCSRGERTSPSSPGARGGGGRTARGRTPGRSRRAVSTTAPGRSPPSESSTPPFRPSTTSWPARRSTTRSTAGRSSSCWVVDSMSIPTCQLMPPSMPSYVRYCPYSTGRA